MLSLSLQFCTNNSPKIILSELSDLAMEAKLNDGRLGRRPLKSMKREIEAHQILLSEISKSIEEYSGCIKVRYHLVISHLEPPLFWLLFIISF